MHKYLVVIVLIYISSVIDASNESSYFPSHLTRNRRQSDGEGCVLPHYPEHGLWKVLNGEARPGQKIPESSVIKFECNPNYRLSAEYPYLVCDDKWSSIRVPECDKLCPPLYPSTTFELKCRDKRGKDIKCSEATEGTYVEYTCASSYETPFGYKKTLLCSDGKWSQNPVCQPVCGKNISDEAKPLIVGVTPNKKLTYPWVVALYQKQNSSYKYICGGSILSLTVVLTAAHCVTNDFGDVHPKENYLVGAGKLYSKYKAEEDKRAQYLELSKIIVHEDFKGDSRRYLADIAVLVVKGEFALSEIVQPVCFNNMNTIYLHPGSVGEVSGWGRTEAEDISEVLRTLRMHFKYEATCAEELPPNWSNKYNIGDKICAGFFNMSISVCDGDSGNGLAFVNPEDNRYYIHGIVSLGPLKGGQCDTQQNTLYTKVANYYEYIDRLLTTYAPKVKDCVLPKQPKNGKWTAEDKDAKPGDAVPLNTVLKIECNRGFKLSSVSNVINCGSAYNMPVCELLCPALNFSNIAGYRCSTKEGQTIDCLEAVDGSHLWYQCPKGYIFPDGTTSNRTCAKGSWGTPQPTCVRPVKTCGKAPNEKAFDTKPEEGLEHPWNVNIYEKQNYSPLKENMYICGGTLISQQLVLTGAVCVSNYRGQVNAKENYFIGAGEVYANYNDSKNVYAQYSGVSDILLHQSYRGETRRYLADIAVLVTKKPFTFNNFVQAICFTDVDTIGLNPGDEGVVLKYREKGKPEVLRIPYKNDETCNRELPSEFADRFQLIDKICAGYDNRSSLCRGDSGKGFYVRNAEEGRYYVYGIVSVSPVVDNVCLSNVLYTSVPFYYDFIGSILAQYS